MNPFIPRNKSKIAIIAGNSNSELKDNLIDKGLELIETKKLNDLYDSISYHPDIIFCPLDYKNIIIAKNVYNKYKDIFLEYGINPIEGNTLLNDKYPKNIGYNVGRIGKYAVHNTKYTDAKLKDELEKRDIEFININQGYSKCSMAIIDDNSIITSDIMMRDELEKRGIDVLLIKPGNIKLPGQKYGFIGGCIGHISNDEIGISGSLKEHPEKERIINFIKEKDMKINILSKENIEDIGSIICI